MTVVELIQLALFPLHIAFLGWLIFDVRRRERRWHRSPQQQFHAELGGALYSLLK
jgi:hypothetical protein